MKKCPECKILVGGPAKTCPLCGTALKPSDVPGGEEPLYPDFSLRTKRRERFPFLAKLFAFISLVVIIVCGVINLLTEGKLSWSLYVIGAIAAAWCSVGLHLLTRVNLNFKLLADLCALSGYLMLIDWLTGWNRWSVNYVLPLLYIGIMITVFILALVFRMYWREYIHSLIVISLLGIIPLLFFLNGEPPTRFLNLAAALLAGVLLIGLLFFAGGKMFSEWRRRLNI